MIVLDTCTLIFDALTPEKMSAKAKRAVHDAEKKDELFCSDISLWEIAMLVEKKRVQPGTDIKTFIELILQARNIQVLSILPEIAALSATYSGFKHYDPADRIIAATAIHYSAHLVTADKHLHHITGLIAIW